MVDVVDDARGAVPPGGDRRHTHGHGLEGVEVRDADLEPQRGIRYVAWLFKGIAILLVIVMAIELFVALADPIPGATATLLGEAVRLLAFAGLLWGGADLALMLIKSHYDLRAARILLARQNTLLARLSNAAEPHDEPQSTETRQVQLHREAH
jgi:hypothetical protein